MQLLLAGLLVCSVTATILPATPSPSNATMLEGTSKPIGKHVSSPSLGCYKKGLTYHNPAMSCGEIYKCNRHAKSAFYWLKTKFGKAKLLKCVLPKLSKSPKPWPMPLPYPSLSACHKKGLTHQNPAMSCAEVHKCNPHAMSGLYWLKTKSGKVKHLKCIMESLCGIKGGWMLVANIDAKMGFPKSMKKIQAKGKMMCVKKNYKKCASAYSSTNDMPYSYVCGMAKGYAYFTPDAFKQFHHKVGLDQMYVDGISITHGMPRKHLWTYTAGHAQVQKGWNRRACSQYMCPCAIGSTQKAPSFVGNDYYCEAANSNGIKRKWYVNNPLWDGAGCPHGNSCCSSSGMPWFTRELPASTTNSIEVRLCTDQHAGDENVGIAELKVYVRDCME